jgi:hypothetical protein
MKDREFLMKELLQICKEYELADQSTLKAFIFIVGCWLTSLMLILVGDISLQSKWGLFLLIFTLGGLIYLAYEVVNHTLSLRSNVQKVVGMLSHMAQKDIDERVG